MTFYKLNKKYKDRIFRLIFQDKAELLKLYNALNNSHYTNPDDLIITTIDDVVYMGMKNDLSFIISNMMNLYEHQSTFSPNLPLRGLFYLASLYRTYVDSFKNKLYTETAVSLPYPQYIVFYNGTMDEPERQELKLSSLYEKPIQNCTPALECTAVVLNINLGHNHELMEQCNTLKEYATFIDTIRLHIANGESFETAIESSVDECIHSDILANVLRKNRAEVIDVILEEYDEEEFRKYLREEATQQGLAEGRAKGRAEGRAEGQNLERIHGIKNLIESFQELHISQEDTISKLIEKYTLSEGDAMSYVSQYWK